MATTSLPGRGLGRALLDRTERWYDRLDEYGLVPGLAHVVALVFVVWTVFPVYWMVSGSLRTRRELLATPPQWLSTALTLENYSELFVQRPAFYEYLLNSVVITIGSTALAVLFGTAATYGFVKYEYPYDLGRFHLPFLVLATRFLPPIVTVIPLYVIFDNVGLLNTQLGLTLAYAAFNIPFVVWMLKGFFAELPDCIIEAAVLDGHTEIGAFFKIVLPMVRPGLLAATIFTIINAWNELLFAVILTSNTRAQTLPVALATFKTAYTIQWELLTVAGTIAMAPVLAFAFLVREKLLRGFTMGAVQ
ncbi:carbohydrate ABC transporter permease [Natrinema amylolyticum]|uniref:carbohydrate ABC transporter permease n=1 Tax=Natrinema amylolyticum TaxID=2878679 RepID=UPI001CFB7A77|nr:carbohydrate ABC transporter permease [Natrinema amylolyticum]